MPWPFGIDPGTCPIYFGLPWGLAIGPLPNIPLPVSIQTRVCPPIIFERYGKKAARDRRYVRECYEKVCYLMQQQLDQFDTTRTYHLRNITTLTRNLSRTITVITQNGVHAKKEVFSANNF